MLQCVPIGGQAAFRELRNPNNWKCTRLHVPVTFWYRWWYCQPFTLIRAKKKGTTVIGIGIKNGCSCHQYGKEVWVVKDQP